VPLQAHPATRSSKNGSGHCNQRWQLSRQRGGLPDGQHFRSKTGRQPQQAPRLSCLLAVFPMRFSGVLSGGARHGAEVLFANDRFETLKTKRIRGVSSMMATPIVVISASTSAITGATSGTSMSRIPVKPYSALSMSTLPGRCRAAQGSLRSTRSRHKIFSNSRLHRKRQSQRTHTLISFQLLPTAPRTQTCR